MNKEYLFEIDFIQKPGNILFNIIEKGSNIVIAKTNGFNKRPLFTHFNSCNKNYILYYYQEKKEVYKVNIIFGLFYYYILIINKKSKTSCILLINQFNTKFMHFNYNGENLIIKYESVFRNIISITNDVKKNICKIETKFDPFFSHFSRKKVVSVSLDCNNDNIYYLLCVCGFLIITDTNIANYEYFGLLPKIFCDKNPPKIPPYWQTDIPFPDYNGNLWVIKLNGNICQLKK